MNAAPDDPYQLERFVTAHATSYEDARAELRSGEKRSHWIWYIFPQVAGLGSSRMAERFAIRSRGEAAAYLAHPVLGPRLAECANALLQIEGKTAEQVMGYPDDLKLRSSMTLFAALSSPHSPYQKVLDRYFSGAADPRTSHYLAVHST